MLSSMVDHYPTLNMGRELYQLVFTCQHWPKYPLLNSKCSVLKSFMCIIILLHHKWRWKSQLSVNKLIYFIFQVLMSLKLLKSNQFLESTSRLAACSSLFFYYIAKTIIFLCCAKCGIFIFRSLLWFVSEWNLKYAKVLRETVLGFRCLFHGTFTILAREHSLHRSKTENLK